jgi:hypothetical protein
MAKQNEHDPLSEEHIDTVIYDAEGKEVLRFGFTNLDSDENGSMRTHREAENVELADGTVINSVALMRLQGGLKVCDICRQQSQRRWRTGTPKVFLALAANVITCSCGKNACRRHWVRSKIDGRLRCRACDRRASRKHFLHRIARVLFYRNA